MDILENYKETLRTSNKKIVKHRSLLNEDGSMVSKGDMQSVNTPLNNTAPVVNKEQNPDQETTGNSHITNWLEANKQKKNKDVMSQVDRVETGIDRMHKVIEKLRKIIHELKHTYLQDQMPKSEPTGDASGASK